MVILYFVLSNYVPTKTEIDPAVYYYCLWHTPSAILSNAKAEGSRRLNGGANLRLVRFPPSLVPNTVDPPRVFFKWESGKFLFLENCYCTYNLHVFLKLKERSTDFYQISNTS